IGGSRSTGILPVWPTDVSPVDCDRRERKQARRPFAAQARCPCSEARARSTFPLQHFPAKAFSGMQLKRSLILVPAASLIVGVLVVCLGPLIMANGLRLWAERVARREGFELQLDNIEAPLLRPMVVRNLRVESGPAAP